ncbi:conserved hypothetical protein [Shewanella halifaxensis HAW-EB4]|uniref:Topoisomerase II n=1 Tax=Shewanella halifaxensis (strain HAW-EB4) TaxID=458817 RepID=B0TQX8_SHEHH|nr:DUF3802 family protein [Shewanella halifaxensis]ABZ76373.1 conserved hypothetical protein [Shewanella halifaxensis HAW-EB4]
MVTDKDGYIHLVQYLTEHLGIFENSQQQSVTEDTVMELFEEQLAAQIIMVCGQNPSLTFSQRNLVVREVDSIVYDLEEILARVSGHKATAEQSVFISELSCLIKNLFDQEIARMISL